MPVKYSRAFSHEPGAGQDPETEPGTDRDADSGGEPAEAPDAEPADQDPVDDQATGPRPFDPLAPDPAPRRSWTEDGPDGPLELRNVIGVLPGSRDEWSASSVVVGAHYDHLGRGWPDVRTGNEGVVHPGADDNASGVAVMLEVAKLLAGGHAPARPIVFIAFDGEEWGRRGSLRYVAHESTRPAEDALAMISLDAVGRLGDGKLLVLGTGTATEWIHIARGIGFTTGVESTAVADDPGGSDQVSFHEVGVPAVQLTSGPHEDYHRPRDTVEKIDAGGMVRVATWLREAVVYLGERDTPLTSTLGGGTAPAPATSGRRVSLGTLPDFADPGPGVRVDSVLPDSPAARAGLLAGDRIVRIDGAAVADLRAYSDVLKSHAPGDTIEGHEMAEQGPIEHFGRDGKVGPVHLLFTMRGNAGKQLVEFVKEVVHVDHPDVDLEDFVTVHTRTTFDGDEYQIVEFQLPFGEKDLDELEDEIRRELDGLEVELPDSVVVEFEGAKRFY